MGRPKGFLRLSIRENRFTVVNDDKEYFLLETLRSQIFGHMGCKAQAFPLSKNSAQDGASFKGEAQRKNITNPIQTNTATIR